MAEAELRPGTRRSRGVIVIGGGKCGAGAGCTRAAQRADGPVELVSITRLEATTRMMA